MTTMTATPQDTLSYGRADSPIGELLLVGGPDGLAGVYFDGHQNAPSVEADWTHDEAQFDDARAQLEEYFRGARTEFDLQLNPSGTAFQQTVWNALREVPYGETTSYGAIAERIGRPTASRAVGTANGRNPLCIVVPCHRIVGSAGALTGYAYGVDRKRWLLDLEAGVSRERG
jgi:methylated-DNA-[protein]-cysteine S-methyltransferase